MTQAAGGYVVSLDLDEALPVKSDLPELVADGSDLGPAAESADGRTLTVTTADPSVAKAKKITWQWSAGGNSTATGPTSLLSAAAQSRARKLTEAEDKANDAITSDIGGSGATADDPTTIGTGSYTIADYNFGAQSIPLAGIGGIRGEFEGRVYLPTDGKAHPVAVFLHGRHSSCYNTTTLRGASGWPCAPGTAPILSYAGYDAAAEALAADGIAVVSISANAINANDNQLAPDNGARSRGQLVLDTLTMLKKANAGQAVSYHDAVTDQDVTLEQALTSGDATYPGGTLTASQLVGSMDFSAIGLMGHSRGGEGVVAAGTLNEALPQPWNIKSVLPLAPVDFTRTTLPDVVTSTMLPYCDGDVSDQQGQHFYADSRDAFADNVLRSDVWVMGADHNFFNSQWTPPSPGGSDDWSSAGDAVCGTNATALASGKNIRLTAPQQYQLGAAYISGFFEATLGGRTQFQGLFDGSQLLPPTVSAFADVRTVAQQPSSGRRDVATFKTTSPLIGTTSTATATVCANKSGRTVPEPYPLCTNPGSTLTNQQLPYWTPASFAPNVPLNVMTHLTWTATTGALGVTLPSAQQNVSRYDEMSVSMSPDESVTTGTDMTLSVTDSSGRTWSSLVSALNTWGVTRMPASGSTTLGKIVLQQVRVPTATLAAAGLDLSHITRVAFTAAVGADGVSTGGVYLSDLGFATKALGTPSPQTRPTVNVASTTSEEGNGPGASAAAVYLSKASTSPVSAYLTVVGSATGKVGLAMQKVTFAPGTTCQVVDIPAAGDTVAGATPSTAYKLGVSNSSNAVLGSQDFGTITVREDDGVTGTATAAPPVGVQGEACAEYEALSRPGSLTVSDARPAPGATVTVGGSGYRDGESVAFTLGSAVLGSAVATSDGTVSFQAALPADQSYGSATISAVGAGSGFTSTGVVEVLATTTTEVTLTPAAPKIGAAVTLKAVVTGDGTDGGTVTFRDGTTVLGTAKATGGTASLKVAAGFKAGTHTFTAAFGGTASADTSTSDPVQLVLTKGQSSIAMALVEKSTSYGRPASGVFSVAGAKSGTVTVNYGTGSLTAKVGTTGAGTFKLPASLAAGTHTVSVRFSGTDSVEPSGVASQKLTVKKARTTTSLTLSKTKLAQGKSETVKVSVGGHTGAAYPTGTITVTAKVGGKTTTRKVTLSADKKGVLSFSITLPKKKGTATVTAVYAGNGNFLASTSARKQVKLT
ncbi:Ig-like domain-containing protein [Streptomyces sp. AK02-01A]|uniref:Ig-like domain-containing protein n=1 Tax=Streptomyces sp. AK02-01A TaxID=3028648 RepID=UPI0029A8AE31|nr:Ig-like domain-containing protein [Streptomyces sp. AK02-01A]MDX3850288.1 Ig-like domain-containing protein [Streptomyces sp. AK02-01A]